MSEVKRYDIAEYGGGMDVIVDGTYVGAEDFDRVTAERDGLQISLNTADQSIDDLNAAISRRTQRVRELEALLTAADERADVLTKALTDVREALGREYWDQYAGLDETREILDAALKPAEAHLNQCDGCQAGIPVVDGAHRMGKPGGYPDTMSCTAKLYKP